jgi:hypothetical protein
LSVPALWSVLGRGFLSRRPAPECLIEFIEQRERYGGPFFYQLVQTHTACPREVLEPLVLRSRQTDGQYRHGSTFFYSEKRSPERFDIHHLAVNSTDSVMRNILDFLPNGVRTPDVKHSR